MALEIKKHKTIGTNEAYIDGLMVGVFEQMNPDNDNYSFMSKCSHDKLTGDHYIAIGEYLNELNGVLLKSNNNELFNQQLITDLKLHLTDLKEQEEMTVEPLQLSGLQFARVNLEVTLEKNNFSRTSTLEGFVCKSVN
jgi:hypothetical protein